MQSAPFRPGTTLCERSVFLDLAGKTRLLLQASPAPTAEKSLLDDYRDEEDDEKKENDSEDLEHE